MCVTAASVSAIVLHIKQHQSKRRCFLEVQHTALSIDPWKSTTWLFWNNNNHNNTLKKIILKSINPLQKALPLYFSRAVVKISFVSPTDGACFPANVFLNAQRVSFSSLIVNNTNKSSAFLMALRPALLCLPALSSQLGRSCLALDAAWRSRVLWLERRRPNFYWPI